MSAHHHASFLFLKDRKIGNKKSPVLSKCEHIRLNATQNVGSFILFWITLMMVVKK